MINDRTIGNCLVSDFGFAFYRGPEKHYYVIISNNCFIFGETLFLKDFEASSAGRLTQSYDRQQSKAMTAEPNSQVNDANAVDNTPAAPVIQTPEEGQQSLGPKNMDRFECLACGYKYEPVKGDDRSNISPGVPFQEIPLNWRCPVCGAPKKRFANIGPAGTPSGFKENLKYGLGVNVLTPGQKSILIFGGLALGFLFFLSLYGLR